MKNGFTLVELLAVIIILAVIAAISTVSIGTIISNSKDNLSDTQKDAIEESAKSYYLKEGNLEENTCVSLNELITKGYIEATEVTDPKTEEVMSGYVKIKYESNQYHYTYMPLTCEANE